MDFDALVEEVYRRVMEKIRALEASNGSTAAFSDKPKMLVLTLPGGTDRDKVLTCPDLNMRYQTELAIDKNYNCVLLGYDVVMAMDLSNDTIKKVGEGMCDDGYSRLLSQALISGKKVFIPAETVEMWKYQNHDSPLLYRTLEKDLDQMRQHGATIAHMADIVKMLNGQEATGSCSYASAPCPAPAPQQFVINASANAAAPAPVRSIEPSITECTPVPAKEISFFKRCITRKDVVAAEHEGATVLIVSENAIITDVARERIAKNGLTVVRSLNSSLRG